jgi:hypothetical protein
MSFDSMAISKEIIWFWGCLGNVLMLDFRDMDGYGSIKPCTKHALEEQPPKQSDARLRFSFDMQGKKTT